MSKRVGVPTPPQSRWISSLPGVIWSIVALDYLTLNECARTLPYLIHRYCIDFQRFHTRDHLQCPRPVAELIARHETHPRWLDYTWWRHHSDPYPRIVDSWVEYDNYFSMMRNKIIDYSYPYRGHHVALVHKELRASDLSNTIQYSIHTAAGAHMALACGHTHWIRNRDGSRIIVAFSINSAHTLVSPRRPC